MLRGRFVTGKQFEYNSMPAFATNYLIGRKQVAMQSMS